MAEPVVLHDVEMRVEYVPLERLRPRMKQLLSAGFTMLVDIGAVDFPERLLRFDVVYHIMKLPLNSSSVTDIGTPERQRVMTQVGGDTPTVASISDLWPSANWAEREIFDLFGISFSGHPDLRRIQMPDDWVGYPLRRDYPLRGPANEATPRPNFPSKSNVPSGTPPAGHVAAAIARRKASQNQTGGT